MRRLVVIVVCLLPLTLSLASANGSSPPVRGKIVYSSDRGPNVHTAEIYSIRADGSGRRNLTRNQGHDGDFAWSPTGDRVAFWADRADASGLYVMRADGSELQRLTPADIRLPGYRAPPTWSPDGRRLAFGAYRQGFGIWVVDADGSDLRHLAEGHYPVWAPVGSRIAFVGPEYAFPLEVVDADGGDPVHVADGQLHAPPTWSPDARALAYVHSAPPIATRTLKRVDADGGVPQVLVSGPDLEIGEPAWSPDGTRIAFSDIRGGVIKAVDANGGVLTAFGAGASPAWSPDSRRIASATDSEIHVTNADGSGRRKVQDETPARITAGPEWSPDGETLLFASLRSRADHELFVANGDGSQERRLTQNNVEDLLPAWSHDHTRIAFARGTGGGSSVWVMSASGTRKHRLALGTHPSWSPSGSRLAFERGGVVYTVTDRGRSVRRITKGKRPVWAPRGTRIAFLRGTKLFVADANTKRVRQVDDIRCESYGEGDPAIPTLSSPEWSPRARRLVVSLGCDYGRSSYIRAVLVDAGGGVTGDLPINLAGGSRLAWSPDGARLAFRLSRELYSDAPRIVTTLLDGSSMTTVSTGAGFDRDPDW